MKHIKQFFILSPIILIIIGEILSSLDFISLSSIVKLTSLLLIFVIVSLYKTKRILFIFLILILFFLLINFENGYNHLAAAESFFRYMTLPLYLLYGYTVRKYFITIVKILVIATFIGDIYYVLQLLNIIHTEFVMTKGELVINFGLYGVGSAIMNFSSFILVNKVLKKPKTSLIFFVFALLTFSFKTIPFLFLSAILLSKSKKKTLLLMTTSILLIVINYYHYIEVIFKQLDARIKFYITVANSARSDSYRVMFDFLTSGISAFFSGTGLGSFGGPSSTKYNSPTYEQFHFNWYGLENELSTTDTYYPHLFVELGLIGALTYLTILFLPLYDKSLKKDSKQLILILLGVFLFESVFSFGLNNPLELLPTVLLFYGIIGFYQNKQLYKMHKRIPQ